MTPEDLENLFTASYTTIFCSHNNDGTIHAAPIWYRYKDGIFFFVSIKKARRVANVKRNNNVSLSFLMQGSRAGEGNNPSKCALVYGEAELGFDPENGMQKYVGWVFDKYGSTPSFNLDNYVTLKVVPKRIVHFYP